MNKICTSIEQSNKLLELGIDRNTADMCWQNNEFPIGFNDDDAIPAWSLSALLELMPNLTGLLKAFKKDYRVVSNFDDMDEGSTEDYTEPIDAMFEMICRLLENGKI